MWYLKVDEEESALVGTALGPGDGRLPVTAVLLEGRRPDALQGVSTQRLQLTAQAPMTPRTLLYRRRALHNDHTTAVIRTCSFCFIV